MPFPEFDPVLIHLGPLPIRWYALAYVAGIVLGWWYASRLAKTERLWAPGKSPVNGQQLDDLVLWITLGVILGGRFGYALFYKPEMFAQLFTGDSWGERLELLQLWTGGMSFHGGFLGVVIAITLYANRQKVNPLSLGDLIAPVAPLGLFFGRIANFINGELWGRETSLPWGVTGFPGVPDGYPRHPSQIYEAILEGLVLFLVLRWATHSKLWLQRRGVVAGLFLAGYGLFRASLEWVREPDAQMFDFLRDYLTMGMLLSIPMIAAGAWLIWRGLKEPATIVDTEKAGA